MAALSDLSSRALVLICLISLFFSAPVIQSAAQEVSPRQPVVTPPTPPPSPKAPAAPASSKPTNYKLGPEDEIVINVLDAAEIGNRPVRIDATGFITVPMVGRVQASGQTLEEFESTLTERLKVYIKEPIVTVSIQTFRSQPVTVLGSVVQPGTHQLEGRKTLIEVIAKAGGIRTDAGYSIKISRRMEFGRLPLPNAVVDPSGETSSAEVGLKGITEARKPEDNIVIMPNDVINVPRGELVYVVGSVKQPGGFVLAERDTISLMQAVAMAGGLAPANKAKNSRIIRPKDKDTPEEIAVDLRKILDGKEKGIALKANDILYVPDSYAKGALQRAGDTAIQAITGIMIYRPFY